MTPRKAILNRHIARLQTDNHDTVEGWIIIDGTEVTLCNQKNGQSPTGEVKFTRRAFNTLIDWYNRDQKMRKPYHLAVAPEFAVVGTCAESPVQVVLASDAALLEQQVKQLQAQLDEKMNVGMVLGDMASGAINLERTRAEQAEARVKELCVEVHNYQEGELNQIRDLQAALATATARVKWLEKIACLCDPMNGYTCAVHDIMKQALAAEPKEQGNG